MAEAPIYYYETVIDWKGEKDLKLTGGQLPAIDAGAPPEFKGREGNWSPEHLFVASLNTCYSLTFLAIAEFSKVALVSFSSSAKGKLEKVAGSTYQVTEIVVKPRVVIASVNDLARMPRILEKAKENCFVSNSIKATIKVEPEVYHQQTQASPCPLGEAPAALTESIERGDK
ncbi:MAG TPA: OsmC family protein [Candidatus Binatia bacterium]|nr:OsmC family protein [Candidatus Binatia bacterium]